MKVTALEVHGLTAQLGNCALVAVAGGNTITASASHVSTNGIIRTLAAFTTAALPVNDARTGVPYAVIPPMHGAVLYIAVGIPTTDRFAYLSEISPLADATTTAAFLRIPPLVEIPELTQCPIGFITIRNRSTTDNFTVRTTNWDAVNVTSVANTISTLPSRPVT